MNSSYRQVSPGDLAASRLAAILDATDEAVIETSLDGLITAWNPAACRLFDYTAAEMQGQTIARLIPDDYRPHEEALAACLARCESGRIAETQYLNKGGRRICVSTRISPLLAPEGHVIGAVRLLRDITRENYQRQEFDRLAALYTALSHVKQSIIRSLSPEELLGEVCRILVDEAGFFTAWVGMHDAQSARFVPVACRGQAADFVRDLRIFADERPAGQGPAGRAFRSQQPIICDDIASDPTTTQWHEQAALFGLQSVADFPIVVNDRCVGLLMVYSREQDYFQEREVNLLFETAGEIGYALDSLERDAARVAAEAHAQSEHAFSEAMINAMPGILYFYDPDGRFVRWNYNFETLSGYAGGEIATMHPLDFFPEAEKARVEQAMAAVFITGEASVEASFLTRTGTTVPHYFTGRRVEMAGRAYLVGVGLDMTEIKAAEKAQAISEQRYRTLFEYAPDGILIGRRDAFVDANDSICRMLGFSRDQVIGVKAFELVARSELEKLQAAVREFDASERYYGKWQLCRADGSTFPAEVLAAGLPDGDVIAMVRDVSEQESAAQALRDLNRTLEQRVTHRTAELAAALQQAEAADRLKSAFLATMSHELRTPLNSIIGFTGLLLQKLAGPINPEQEKQLGMVRGSARHLLDLINDVLDISKIEAGQLKVTHEPFDLAQAVERAVALIAPMADKKGLSLDITTGDIPAQLCSDRRRVEQILINLLNNAVKFTDTGGVTLRVAVEPAFEDKAEQGSERAIRIIVSDTGIGIKREDLDNLFQPFRQLDNGLSRQHEGTGLGLAICRRLANLLDGTIGARSTPGKGSTFTLTLPMQEYGTDASHRRVD